ncbi:dihydrofolate reductase family protein [Streptomyces flaveolus]|uniref:dihydrofolate reductase family protein n=1 Tax=Streptomyces flaveolus TaxID=67297 RepID=UPI003701BD7B
MPAITPSSWKVHVGQNETLRDSSDSGPPSSVWRAPTRATRASRSGSSTPTRWSCPPPSTRHRGERTTIVNKPAAQVADDLKGTRGGDILVLSSASVIKALLGAGEVDRPALTVFPVPLGGGPRLFDDGLPTSKRALISRTAGEDGTPALVYDHLH